MRCISLMNQMVVFKYWKNIFSIFFVIATNTFNLHNYLLHYLTMSMKAWVAESSQRKYSWEWNKNRRRQNRKMQPVREFGDIALAPGSGRAWWHPNSPGLLHEPKIFLFVSINLIQVVFLLLLTQGDLISKLYILPKGEVLNIWLRNLDFGEIQYSTMRRLSLSLQCQVHYLPLLRS